MGPKPMTGSLMKRGDLDKETLTDTPRERASRPWGGHSARPQKRHGWRLTERGSPGGTSPADTLTSDPRPPELPDSTSLGLVHHLWHFVMAALAQESTHQVNRKKYKRSNRQVQRAWLEEVEDVMLLKDERWMQGEKRRITQSGRAQKLSLVEGCQKPRQLQEKFRVKILIFQTEHSHGCLRQEGSTHLPAPREAVMTGGALDLQQPSLHLPTRRAGPRQARGPELCQKLGAWHRRQHNQLRRRQRLELLRKQDPCTGLALNHIQSWKHKHRILRKHIKIQLCWEDGRKCKEGYTGDESSPLTPESHFLWEGLQSENQAIEVQACMHVHSHTHGPKSHTKQAEELLSGSSDQEWESI